MLNQPDYQTAMNRLGYRLPREVSHRVFDMEQLLSTDRSFSISSIPRNGTTTLMKDYAKRKDGHYICCHEKTTISSIEHRIGNTTTPVMLDELFYLLNNSGLDIMIPLLDLAKKRQVGLRLRHKSSGINDFIMRHGFPEIKVGKIPRNEFQAIYEWGVQGTGIEIPERLIQAAYDGDDSLYYNISFLFRIVEFMERGREVETIVPQEVRTEVIRRGSTAFSHLNEL